MKHTTAPVALISMFPLLMACAGPATPFGAIDEIVPLPFFPEYQARQHCVGVLAESPSCRQLLIHHLRVSEPGEVREPQVDFIFRPPRQIWHQLSDFTIDVLSETPVSDPEFQIFYNVNDVTKVFLSHATVTGSEDRLSMRYAFRDLQLPASSQHEISIVFRPNPWAEAVEVNYSEPICRSDEQWSVRNTRPFDPDPSLLSLIEHLSIEGSTNPSLISGLIAQESGFEPEAVSWAKAIGLTQVTELADQELEKRFKNWPRNPDVSEMSVPLIKSMIKIGHINPDNDWRLNPAYSIQGGIEYLGIVSEYWSRADNRAILATLHLDSPDELLNVLLASYNSGPARVKQQIKNLKADWLMSEQLKEANRYVRKIRSYCYHFSREDNV